MSVNLGAGSQAGQQAQDSGSQGSQGTQSGQQSLGDQLYGQQGSQGQSQPGAGEGQLLEGQRAGESLADYAKRMNSELTRARSDAGKYRTRLRQYESEDAGGEGNGQQANQGSENQQGQQAGANPLATLQATVSQLQRDLTNERNARKAERTTSSLTSALASAGASNAARAVRMIDTSELQTSSDGTPTPESIEQAIEALRADMPQLFSDVRGSGDGGAGNAGGGEPDDFNAQLRKRAGIRR